MPGADMYLREYISNSGETERSRASMAVDDMVGDQDF